MRPDPDAGQLHDPGRPVKAEGGRCEWRRRRRQRQVAENQHAVVPHQVNYLLRIHGHVPHQRNDVPFPGRVGPPHQQRRHGWVASGGGVHLTSVTGADLALTWLPAKSPDR